MLPYSDNVFISVSVYFGKVSGIRLNRAIDLSSRITIRR